MSLEETSEKSTGKKTEPSLPWNNGRLRNSVEGLTGDCDDECVVLSLIGFSSLFGSLNV